ncbi:MAG: HEAT repeat domain-containing protein [Verrucomicrobiota bacterium]
MQNSLDNLTGSSGGWRHCSPVTGPLAVRAGSHLRIGNPRYGRLEVCATPKIWILWIMAWRLGLAAILAGCVLTARAAAGGGNPERTKELVAVLRSEAPLFDKARACQQLGEIGTKEAVPALAELLADEHLGAYARSGLEGIPDPSAAAALRTALGTLKGSLLAGVINSLGVLRDAQAVGALRPLAEEPASGVAREALLALGRIATGQSIPILRQALVAGPEALRADAAAACLLAAEKQLADGQAQMAVTLNDAVRTASVPAVYRAAATRGAILARQSDGVTFLMEQLRAEDPVVRQAALLTIREMPGPALAGALNAELDKAGPELELQLISALADCHNAQSLELLEAKAAGGDPGVRRAALRVLASIAGPSQAGVLLKVLAENRGAAESMVAASSLERMEGAAVDDLVLEALLSAREARARVQLIRLLEVRGATSAVAELLKQAADPDETVSLAAFGALRALAGAGEVPALIALTKACKDERARDAAENAICSASTSTGNAEAAGDAVLAELERSAGPAEKNAWVRILISLGYAKALPALEAAMKDSNEAVAANAIENLGRWPDPGPVEALLAVVDTCPNPRSRQRALASVIQLAAVAADEHQRPDALVVGWLERASPAAHSLAERRRLISVLGRLKRLESFRLLLPWLDQPDLQTEAALAVVQIAPALVDSEDSAALKSALEKIAATAKNPDIRGQAVKLAQSIAERTVKTRP